MRTAKSCLWLGLVWLCCACQLSSSTKTDDQLPGTWRLSDVTSLGLASNHGQSFEEEAQTKQLVKEGMALCLFEDQSFTEIDNRGQLITGQWEYRKDNSTLVMTGSGSTKTILPVKLEKNQFKRQVMHMTRADQNIELQFVKSEAPVKDFKSDPFYPTNNTWRIKPGHQETEAELVNRFAGYLKHVALILKSAKERSQDVVSFEFSKGPIKIYNGGIGIYDYTIVPDSWKGCFYNDHDAHQAYALYENYLRTSSFQGAGTGNWVDDDYSILLSIYSGLQGAAEKLKSPSHH